MYESFGNGFVIWRFLSTFGKDCAISNHQTLQSKIPIEFA